MTDFLKTWGWVGPEAIPPLAKVPLSIARVIQENKGGYWLQSDVGELWAEVSGRLSHETESRLELPVVGDWVWIHPAEVGLIALIHAIVPRRTLLSRIDPKPHSVAAQPLAANVDLVLVMTSLNKEFSASRLERYGAIVRQSGADLAILLNKADLCPDPKTYLQQVQEALPNVPVFLVSALKGEGVDTLEPLLRPGLCAVLLGSSGIGKSTLLNRLLGKGRQETQTIDEQGDRGRHTTTARSLLRLPQGALLIDTPGLRQIALRDGDDAIGSAFADIEALTIQCRFGNCSHEQEADCAVRAALNSGQLPERRYKNYRKLLNEQAFLNRKLDNNAAQRHKQSVKKIHQQLKDHYKNKPE